MMLRDVFTVTRGEAVKILAGGAPYATGYFLCLDEEEGFILVDAPRHQPYPVKVSVYSRWLEVVDSHGNCLGLLESEPDLRGAVPDLE